MILTPLSFIDNGALSSDGLLFLLLKHFSKDKIVDLVEAIADLSSNKVFEAC